MADQSSKRIEWNDWSIALVPHTTRCKHGFGDCEKCGTTNLRDAIHTSRTPNKREARRARKKAKP